MSPKTALILVALLGSAGAAATTSESLACETETGSECVRDRDGRVIFRNPAYDNMNAELLVAGKTMTLRAESQTVLRSLHPDYGLEGHRTLAVFVGDGVRATLIETVTSQTCAYRDPATRNYTDDGKCCGGTSDVVIRVQKDGHRLLMKGRRDWGA